MFLLVTSFLAGILTVFAPCVLILLPVIVGSSLTTDTNKKIDRKKPYIIAFSLGVSVLLFTLLLKASTVLINVDPQVWKTISGVIVIILALSLLFPLTWAKLSAKIGIEQGSNSLLARANKKTGSLGYVMTGAALGPVFSACSPIYALILATVLPVNIALGLVYMTLYASGLSLALLAIALAGRRLTKRVTWTAKPDGWFRRSLAILLLLVGIGVITGFDKKVQTWTLIHIPFNSTKIEEKLLPKDESAAATAAQNNATLAKFNVQPYPAPELQSIQAWINSDGETLAQLRGKVVLIDFWTYSCINCQRTQPYLNSWYQKYKDKGLVILGIHAPEFAFEKVPENVQKAVTDAKIGYPVGLDNNFATWQAYKNQYWPAKYLIDKNGMVRLTHFGEGNYDETEAAIQTLLKENGANINESLTGGNQQVPVHSGQTPETYLGYERGERFANASEFKQDTSVEYKAVAVSKLENNQWSLGGAWTMGAKDTQSGADGAKLILKFSAKEVYLVMGGTGKAASLSLNGQPVTASKHGGTDVDVNGKFYPKEARLYRIINTKDFTTNGILEITLPQGTTVNAFTFGG